MSSRRDEILREMGLTPVWRLRAKAGSAARPETQRSGSAELAALQGAVASGETSFDEAGPSPALQEGAVAALARRPGAGEALQGSAARGAPSALRDDRRAAIMRMDWVELEGAVSQCIACPLHAKRNKTVFGVGDENADWMFVGEGPGADEDAQGEPFVGQAGKLLDNMLAAIRLKRGENVYIANVVKCRPPGNRNPVPEEALKCEPYLQRQIELVKPKLIIALGRVAALNLLSKEASIASLRGRVLDYKGTPLIVTYHPAYLLRSLADKAKAWEDLCFAVRTMQGLRAQSNAE